MHKLLFTGLFFLLLTLGGQEAFCAEKIVVDEATPPIMYAQDGQAKGVYPALLKELSRRIHVALTITPMPWKRALAEIYGGKAGGGGMLKTTERLAICDFSNKLFDEVQIVYVTKGKEFAVTGLDSLKGKKVGIIRGWSYGDAFDDRVRAGDIVTEEGSGDAQNLAKLAIGRLDAVLSIRESGIVAAARYGDRITALDQPLITNPSYIGFAKSAHKRELIEKLNNALAEMHRDGSFDHIVTSAVLVD